MTLGLAFPWVAVWSLRRVAERVTFEGMIDFAAIAQRTVAAGAGGDALADALDVGLGVDSAVQGFAGELYDGQSALARPVLVTVEIGGLRLRADDRWGVSSGVGPGVGSSVGSGELGFWPTDGLRLEALGDDLLHVSHPAAAPGALLSSRAPGFASALAPLGRSPRGMPSGRRLVRLGLLLGGALVALLILVYASLPLVAHTLARRVPLEVERRIGFQVEALLEDRYCHGEPARAALEGLLARLQLPASHGPTATKVRIMNWELANAFTLPGGTVVLTRGLIAEAQDPDEIAGVLAHELEHVRQRHVMAHIIRSSILSLGWSVSVGDFSGSMVIDPSTAFAIANERFSRADERSADAGALARLDRAGIGRAGLAAFFRRLQDKTDQVPAWLSTHPASQERAAAIAVGPSTAARPALDAEGWKALQAACAKKTSDGL